MAAQIEAHERKLKAQFLAEHMPRYRAVAERLAAQRRAMAQDEAELEMLAAALAGIAPGGLPAVPA